MTDSIQDIAEKINFNYTDESRCEFGPVDDSEWWLMFANVKESTRIYIRTED